ncbi:hypothetical protein [Duganella phyllosphaerae]|uniref:hypothetical protein n=1 Tax=Duganella phyllosphaerae TaxID=762836 RepID=UPI001428CADE|nr:hypothetical protein [Duganella phyllosphaerae]
MPADFAARQYVVLAAVDDVEFCTSCCIMVVSGHECDKLPLDASVGEKVLALARDWPRGRKYEALLEAGAAGGD